MRPGGPVHGIVTKTAHKFMTGDLIGGALGALGVGVSRGLGVQG